MSLAACGQKGFETASSLTPCLGENCSNDKNGQDTTKSKDELWQQATVEGQVSDGLLKGHQVITIDKANKMFLVKLPLGLFHAEMEVTIPEIPGSIVTIEQASNGTAVLVVKVPIEYVLGRLGFKPGDLGHDPTKLPNGKPLPDFVGGEYPSVMFRIPKLDQPTYLYFGKDAIAVYVEMPQIQMPIGYGPHRIVNKNKTEIIGYFSIVAQTGVHPGGFYMSFMLPRRISVILDDLI